jgi:CubicO group peptidase (beta-lactamase class C family)
MKRIGSHAVRAALFFLSAILLFASPARGSPTDDEVDAYVREAMAERHIPGLALAVVRESKIERLASYGLASIELAVPVTPTTLFHIASVTKSFTAVGIMKLVEAGEVALDDSIATFLDGLPDRWQGVTIRQLLSHTSGLPDIVRNGSPEPIAQTLEETLSLLRDEPMRFAAGSRYFYDQTDYMLLGLLIEKLSGMPYTEFCKARLFAPAGLSDPSFGDTQTLIMHRSPIYTPIRSDVDGPAIATERLGVLNFESPAMVYPNNGLFISATDLARWLIALMNHELISESSLETLMEPLRLSDGSLSEFPPSPRYPWRVATVGGLLGVPDAEHPGVGGTGGPYAAYLLYPKDGLAVVVLTNTQESNPDSIVGDIAQIYLQASQVIE